MGVPFQVPAKGMEYHNKTGREIHGFILFEKHAGNNTVDSMEKTVKQCSVIQEKLAEILINGKNTVTVGDIYKFKGHGSSTPHGVEIPAGRTEPAVAAEGNKFQPATFGTAIHGTAKGGIAAVDHFIHVFYYGLTWM